MKEREWIAYFTKRIAETELAAYKAQGGWLMKEKEWIEYFTRRLAEAEKELANFKAAIANHGLRVRHRDKHGERDVTDQALKDLENTAEEYRSLLRDE
jgi:hypothetical protein